MDYAIQTEFSDPGIHGALYDALPDDPAGIGAVTRELVIHYHYNEAGIKFTGDRLAEIDHRWVSAMLATDQKRNGTPLAVRREPTDRLVGCCRDYTLLFVSALRHKGIPARSRIGFGGYFTPGFNHDHVVAEYWNGDRWVMVDSQLDPAEDRPFDVLDMPPGKFRSAAEVWLGVRAGELDADLFGVDPGLPIRGGWFVRNYVHLQHAHLNGDELLLWDNWGAMSPSLDGADLDLTDQVATLLVASDNGDEAATKEMFDLYRSNPKLTYAGRSFVTSPAATEYRWTDLRRPADIGA